MIIGNVILRLRTSEAEAFAFKKDITPGLVILICQIFDWTGPVQENLNLNLANLWFRFSKFLTKMCKYQIREFCFNIGIFRINWGWGLWSTNYKCTCKSMQDWNLIILMKCWNFVATQICIKIKIEWGRGKSEIKSFERVKSRGQRAKWNRIKWEIFFAFI